MVEAGVIYASECHQIWEVIFAVIQWELVTCLSKKGDLRQTKRRKRKNTKDTQIGPDIDPHSTDVKYFSDFSIFVGRGPESN